jgi:hypothetical protein
MDSCFRERILRSLAREQASAVVVELFTYAMTWWIEYRCGACAPSAFFTCIIAVVIAVALVLAVLAWAGLLGAPVMLRP